MQDDTNDHGAVEPTTVDSPAMQPLIVASPAVESFAMEPSAAESFESIPPPCSARGRTKERNRGIPPFAVHNLSGGRSTSK